MGSIRSVVACLSLAAIARKMSASAGQCVPGTSCARPADAPGLLRLTSVPGYDQNRVNDVLLLRPTAGTRRRCDNDRENLQNGNAHVVFFPGDIQVGAFPEPRYHYVSLLGSQDTRLLLGYNIVKI